MMKPLFVFVFLLSAILFFGCGQNSENASESEQTSAESTPAADSTPAPAPSASSAPQPVAPAGQTGTAAGIQWAIPATWTTQPERPMRVVTYSIPAASGDAEGGECGVFFFGSGQGGDVRGNIDRWIGQFKTDAKPEESAKTVNGLQVTTVKISGTYMAPGGPMMQSQGEKPNYRLIGAIVQAPEGAIFFKTTGPAATIAASEADFNALVDSIQKAQ